MPFVLGVAVCCVLTIDIDDVPCIRKNQQHQAEQAGLERA
jgi:hypothetical protein